MLDKNKEQLQI